MPDLLRRNHVIGEAISAGKFAEARRGVWEALYDRDPAGTEQVLAVLASSPVLLAEEPYPRSWLPELARPSRNHRTPRPATTAAPLPVSAASVAAVPADGLTPEAVAAWTRQLFPDVGAAHGRVHKAND